MNVSYGEVERAAIAILKSERRPTVETVREALGRGSPATIGGFLRRVWRDLGIRMEGDPAALTRMPAEIADGEEIAVKASPMSTGRQVRSGAASIDTASWITLRWTPGTRYFRVHLEQDLWHGWLLTKVNGRIGTRLGRERAVQSPSIEAALLTLAAIATRRRQRGYDLKN
jgi:hypothetical protein